MGGGQGGWVGASGSRASLRSPRSARLDALLVLASATGFGIGRRPPLRITPFSFPLPPYPRLTVGTLEMTEIRIPANSNKVHADLKNLLVRIKHRDSWDAFTVATLNSDKVKWRVKGSIKVAVSGLSWAYQHGESGGGAPGTAHCCPLGGGVPGTAHC